MVVAVLIAFTLGTVFGYIMCAVLSANTTDEEWQKIAGVPAQPEIIHCEECVFYEAEDGWCEMHSGYGFWEKAFCSFAKRREVTT